MTALLDHYHRPLANAKKRRLAPAALGECETITAQPVCVNLDIYEGDDVILDIAVVDEFGAPVDLSAWGGATPRAEIRPTPADDTVLAEFDCRVETATPDVIRIRLSSLVNIQMPDRAVWDLQVLWYGVLTTLVTGTVTWTAEVTRP
jgi:hypothetical protein